MVLPREYMVADLDVRPPQTGRPRPTAVAVICTATILAWRLCRILPPKRWVPCLPARVLVSGLITRMRGQTQRGLGLTGGGQTHGGGGDGGGGGVADGVGVGVTTTTTGGGTGGGQKSPRLER